MADFGISAKRYCLSVVVGELRVIFDQVLSLTIAGCTIEIQSQLFDSGVFAREIVTKSGLIYVPYEL